MELKGYLRIVLRRLWIFLATLAITMGAVITLTANQTPMYQSVTTYVVMASLPEPDVRAAASVVGGLSSDQIERTVAQVAKSQVIGSRAASELGLTGGQMADVSVSSRVLPGTDVVEIVVKGPDPYVAQNVASAIGPLTAKFLQGPNWLYDLVILDQPTFPVWPSEPKWIVNLVLGAIAAFVLGSGMALFLAYLEKPTEEKAPPAGLVADKRADQSQVDLRFPLSDFVAKATAAQSAADKK